MPPSELVVSLLTGPPGAGKTTALTALDHSCPQLARFGVRDYGLHLAATGHPLGLRLREPLLANEILPNDLVRQEFEHFLETLPGGVRFVAVESYPRDLAQCADLTAALGRYGVTVARFVVLTISDETARDRVRQRRVCRRCGTTADHGRAVCPACGGETRGRRDDDPNRLRQRLRAYRAEGRDVLAHFERLGLVTILDGSRPTEEVRAALARVLVDADEDRPGARRPSPRLASVPTERES